jgi:hypothetical protein
VFWNETVHPLVKRFSHSSTSNLSEVARECPVSRKKVAHEKFYVFDAGVFGLLVDRFITDL